MDLLEVLTIFQKIRYSNGKKEREKYYENLKYSKAMRVFSIKMNTIPDELIYLIKLVFSDIE